MARKAPGRPLRVRAGAPVRHGKSAYDEKRHQAALAEKPQRLPGLCTTVPQSRDP